MLFRSFLSTSQTQLTYHGLFLLSSLLPRGSLSALFRNSHLSVIYRRPFPGQGQPELFTLVTDSSFTGDEGIVWESLEDVEGGLSEFFDAALSRRGGGDWVGRRPRRNEEPRRDEQEPIDDGGNPECVSRSSRSLSADQPRDGQPRPRAPAPARGGPVREAAAGPTEAQGGAGPTERGATATSPRGRSRGATEAAAAAAEEGKVEGQVCGHVACMRILPGAAAGSGT